MSTLTAAFAIAGIASHLLYFNRGEHHFYGWRYVGLFTSSCVLSTLYLMQPSGFHATFSQAISTTARLALAWLVGVYSSLLFYRLCWAPINKFPGPWPAKFSSLYWSTRMAKLDTYNHLYALHKQYGPYVRFGSNELSITDVDAIQSSYEASSPAMKGEWYDMSAPSISLQTTRDKALHARRRRVWAPGFSDRALAGYEPTVKVFNEKLVSRVQDNLGKPIDMQKWFALYGFDVMGKLAFGIDYKMLDSGDRHEAIDVMAKGIKISGYRFPMWFPRMVLATPGLASNFKKFVAFTRSQLKWRVENDNGEAGKVEDVTSWLLKAYKDIDHPETDPLLGGDTRLIIIAGSDTTSATFTFLFYELARNPEYIKKTRGELRELIGSKDDWLDQDLRHADYLNGAINEALRLHPPVPSGVQRVTPKEGMTFGTTFVPGGIHYWIPQYVLSRDEKNYEQAEAFIPERWFSRPEMIKRREAFAPFSLGPFNCIGKNRESMPKHFRYVHKVGRLTSCLIVAYLELRTLTAQLLLKYDVALAPDEDGHRLLYESKDHLTMTLAALNLVFTEVRS